MAITLVDADVDEESTGILSPDRTTTDGLTTRSGPAESSTIPITAPSPRLYNAEEVVMSHRQPEETRPETNSQQYDHREDQTGLDEEGLASPDGMPKRVDSINISPSTTNLSRQLHHLFGVSAGILPNIANHLTIAREC